MAVRKRFNGNSGCNRYYSRCSSGKKRIDLLDSYKRGLEIHAYWSKYIYG
jgi:hypothetical protein